LNRLAAVLLAFLLSESLSTAQSVVTGIEVLRSEGFRPLAGKRIGLITNPTGIDGERHSTIDILAGAPGVKLAALFGPEHGVRGDQAAGASVASSTDPATGLPAYSLYGRTRKPTEAMLAGIDALVWDIQDIGARSYTFVSTMGLCMEAAAEHHIPFVVLDRPDPVDGIHVEGNRPSSRYRSFVGRYPIPYRYGMTAGELAALLNGERMLEGGEACDLKVIPMRGWRRDMVWSQTGLPWIRTSPNVPYPETALFYGATGIVGELKALSIGIGTPHPFELAGAPGISGERLAAELRGRGLAGFDFKPTTWTPSHGVHSGEACSGVRIVITDPGRAELTRLNFEIMDAVRRVSPDTAFFPSAEDRMFDLVCGTSEVRTMFAAGRSAAEIWSAWNAGAERFRALRERYLLYR
jgi:uncharacterized protein YbbC (DUF1343 family)